MNLPSGDTSTALVDPQVRPSGNLKYPSIVWYGFGKSLVGVAVACAESAAPASETAAVTAAPRVTLNRSTRTIKPPPSDRAAAPNANSVSTAKPVAGCAESYAGSGTHRKEWRHERLVRPPGGRRDRQGMKVNLACADAPLPHGQRNAPFLGRTSARTRT